MDTEKFPKATQPDDPSGECGYPNTSYCQQAPFCHCALCRGECLCPGCQEKTSVYIQELLDRRNKRK